MRMKHVSCNLGAPSLMAADSTWSNDRLSISKDEPKGFNQTRPQTRTATTFPPSREVDLDAMFEIAAMGNKNDSDGYEESRGHQRSGAVARCGII